MELRKVQLTGGSSLTVTLPKAWADRARVEAGDVVGCAELADGSLAVHAHVRGEREPQRYVVEIRDAPRDYIFRKIIAAYLMGFDVVVVKSKQPLAPASRLAVRAAVRRIMGLEIVDEEPNAITVQDFLDPREFHIDKALRRMGMLTQAMQVEAVAALRSPDPDIVQSIADRDDEVDRLFWLVNKQYHAMLRDARYANRMELTASQALNFLLAARLVERTADHAKRMAEQTVALRQRPIPADVVTAFEADAKRAIAIFKETLETFVRRDARRANGVIEAADAFMAGQEKLVRLAASAGGEDVAHLAFIAESIGRTAAYGADIGEVAINHTVATV